MSGTDTTPPEPLFGDESNLDLGLQKQAKYAKDIEQAMQNAAKAAAQIKQSAAGSGSSGFGSYGIGSSSNGNILSGALGQIASGMSSGSVQQRALQTASTMIGAMPGVNPIVDRAAGYYQAGISGGVANRNILERTTFRGLAGGMTSPYSDATVANMLLGRGMNYSANPASTYMQTLTGVRSAAQYLNMPNETAANALENLTSGPTSSNLLMTYGIFTADPMTGKEKTQGQIFNEIWGRLTAGRGKMTTAQTMEELRRGPLGSSIRNAPLSEDQKRLFAQFAIEKSKGRTMDLSDPAAMKAMINEATAGGNANPLKPTQEIFTAETGRAANYEGQYISGMQGAADSLKVLNPLFDAFTKNVGTLTSYLQTMGSTQTGNATMSIFSSFFGGKAAVPGGNGDLMGMGMSNVAASMSAPNVGGSSASGTSTPSTTGGARTAGSSSSAASSGSGSFQLRLIRPVSGGGITCAFGVVDKMHPNGHNGMDFGVPEGTSVRAAAAGTVKNKGNNGDALGYQTYIDHGNGYITGYCHLSTRLVPSGTYVEQGQEIAKSGNTGTATTGAHLHLSLTKNGSYTDPAPYINGGGGSGSSTPSSSTNSTPASDPAAKGTNAANYMPVGDPGTSGLVSVSSTGVQGGSSSPVSETGLTVIGGSGFGKVNGKFSSTNSNSPTNPASGSIGTGGGESVGLAGDITGGSGASNSKNNVVINLQIAKATDEEARRFADVVKTYLEDRSLLTNMGRR